MRRLISCLVLAAMTMLLAPQPILHAHSGPPFPVLSNRIIGAYDISIWTDPDSTDDKTPAGKFWIVIDPSSRGGSIPAATRATVTIKPLDRPDEALSGRTQPVEGSVSRQFVALLMDHEGPFTVHVSVDGPLGRADVDTKVDATYDLRPAPIMLAVYLFPFLAIGALWVKVLMRRKRAGAKPQ
jgi:hypothetical protein